MFRSLLWLPVSLGVVAGCSEYTVQNEPKPEVLPVPDILVEPSALSYAELGSGEEATQTFTVTNQGESTLHVENIVIGSGLAFRIAGPETTFDLEPAESTTVDVVFSPMGANENFGQVLVLSDDPDTPEATVDLLGLGAVPELEITPESHVFGSAFIPCGVTQEIELKNVGNEDLRIDDLSYRSAGMLTLDDSALRPELPVVLAPGESRFVSVTFTPATAGSDTGILDVTSSDPRGVVSADQNGEGSYADSAVEVFTEPGVPPVDVMFLVDNSCSMEEDNQDDVQNGIPLFLAELQTVSDWQMIEVTAQNGCANGGIIYPTTPNAETLLINNAFSNPGNTLTESLLQLADVALDATAPGQCNEGFLRPGALLHIIVLSDEREQSGQPYTHWLGQYENHVAREFVKVSAVVDVNSNCGNQPGANGPGGYLEAANATGGSLLNICNANWGADFSDIASDILDGIRTYNLAEAAAPDTIVVTVNGTPTTDFTYDGAGAVTINSPPVGEGDLVEISYDVLAVCNP
jgi:hypothetical protein